MMAVQIARWLARVDEPMRLRRRRRFDIKPCPNNALAIHLLRPRLENPQPARIAGKLYPHRPGSDKAGGRMIGH
jgi:hypothetical protein